MRIEEQMLLRYDGARASLIGLARYAGEFDERALVEHLRGGEMAARARREAGGDAGMGFGAWVRLAIHDPMASIERFQVARRELQSADAQAHEDVRLAEEGLRRIDADLAALPPTRLLDPDFSVMHLQEKLEGGASLRPVDPSELRQHAAALLRLRRLGIITSPSLAFQRAVASQESSAARISWRVAANRCVRAANLPRDGGIRRGLGGG